MTAPLNTPTPIARARTTRARDVRIPALIAMLAVGWTFFGLGLIAIGAFTYVAITSGDMLATFQASGILVMVGGYATGIGLSFLFTTWILTAIKQMFHAHATGWRGDY